MSGKAWAVALFGLTTVLYVAGVVLVFLLGQTLSLNEAALPAAYSYAVVGFLIALNRPANAIAWICLAIGFVWGLESVLTGVAAYGLANPDSVPSVEAIAVSGAFLWYPGIFGITTFLLMFFPDGRLPSPRWRWLPWTTGTGLAVGYPLILLSWPDVYSYGREELRMDNPYALLPPAVSNVILVVILAATAGSVAALIVRYRRSRGAERQQLKWLVAAGSGFAVVFLPVAFLGDLFDEDAVETLGLVVFMFSIVIPISIGLAVLRYRLYDIDRLISRTVTYTLIVGSLAAVFAAVAIGLPRLIGVPEENPVLVAAATLAVAGLFNPLRRRLQFWVDRRFNRGRYDAQHEVDRFAERVRDEVELDDLADGMLDVVDKTMQPIAAAVWMRDEP
jgi:hypothetical protein